MAEEDLIFGKKRHLFGGIEPSNMIELSYILENNQVKITVKLPKDTVVNTQTLCTVKGAVIRRKTTGYPKDEFDGDLVADVKQDTIIVDPTADISKTYYYMAFPYTTQGVYNRNEQNRMVVNEPAPMTRFEVTGYFDHKTSKPSVEVLVQMQDGATGVMIRKSKTGFPKDETDGELFKDVTANGKHVDNDVLVGSTYYYSAFPYNASKTYLKNPRNKDSVKVEKYNYIYGFDINTKDPNPQTRVTYPYEVHNTNFKPAHMDYATGQFDYGDWNIEPGDKFMPRPCIYNRKDNVVKQYLDPNDYSKTINGELSGISTVVKDEYAVMEWSKIYTKRWEENGVYKFRCSDTKHDDTWDCWCNYDINDKEIEKFYISIYPIGDGGHWYVSKSGLLPLDEPCDDIKMHIYSSETTVYSSPFMLSDLLLIQDLLILMGKSTNCQDIFGNGLKDHYSYKYRNGLMDQKGLFWGSNDISNGVKVFGIENIWGGYVHFVLGLNAYGYHGSEYSVKYMVKITLGIHDGSESKGINSQGRNSIQIDLQPFSSIKFNTRNFSGYIDDMLVLPYGRLPKLGADKLKGSTSTFESDYIQFNGQGYVSGSWTESPSVMLLGQHNEQADGPFSYMMYLEDYKATACSYVSFKPTV